jgi:hypothetical protein
LVACQRESYFDAIYDMKLLVLIKVNFVARADPTGEVSAMITDFH